MIAARGRSKLAALVPWLLLTASLILVFGRLKHPMAILPLWRPWAEIGVLACGMTAVFVSGGIDLSVGSTVALCGAVLGQSWSRLGCPLALACALAMMAGALAGAVNGSLVSLRIAPQMATLATLAVYSGLTLVLAPAAGERTVGFPGSFTRLGQGNWLGLPCQLWVLLAVATFYGFLLHHTRFGRTLYAIGDNRTAAGFAALPVRRRERRLYALNGLLAGVVALSYTARNGAAITSGATGLEWPVIAVVLLGGTRATGGGGGIGRTLLGVATLAHLEIGLRLLGEVPVRIAGTGLYLILDTNSRLVVIVLLVLAVAVLNGRLAGPPD